MRAFILAAGLGTRLRPFTLHHPKALVPVGGKPMLQRVIDNLHSAGADDIIINIHHLGGQIINFVHENAEFCGDVRLSDEREALLDTGGALLHAKKLIEGDDSPVLVHNVDILSNANLRRLYEWHTERDNDLSLLVSERKSSRHLIFDDQGRLKGWHHVGENKYRPEGYILESEDREYAFSGIYVFSPRIFTVMREMGYEGKFSIIDFMLATTEKLKIEGYVADNLQLIDIGKPETLREADELLAQN